MRSDEARGIGQGVAGNESRPRVLVTGANGLIGGVLMDAWRAPGSRFQPVGLARQAGPNADIALYSLYRNEIDFRGAHAADSRELAEVLPLLADGRHLAVKRRIKADHLRQMWMTLAKGFDQFDL